MYFVHNSKIKILNIFLSPETQPLLDSLKYLCSEGRTSIRKIIVDLFYVFQTYIYDISYKIFQKGHIILENLK